MSVKPQILTLDSFFITEEINNDLLTIEQTTLIKKILITNKKIDSTSNYSNFLTKSLPLLLNTLKTTSENTLRLLCCDTISIWTLRSQQVSLKDLKFATTLQSLIDLDCLNYLFSYIIDYWNETGAALSNSLRDLLSKLIVLVKGYETSQEIFQSWLVKTLKIPNERRVRYYLIESLTKELEDNSFVLREDPTFIEDAVKLINSNSIGSGVGHAIVSVLQAAYKEESPLEWYRSNWGPIVDALNSDDRELKKGIKKNLLPGLLAISRVAFDLLINAFKDHNDQEFYIYLLTIGQQLLIEDDPFPSIVSLDAVEHLLTQESHKIDVFKLITYSAKGAKPIRPEIFTLLKKNLGQFFCDVEVETRMQFLSLFKQFIYRLKDSTYACQRDADRWLKKNFTEQAAPLLLHVEQSKEFIEWLLTFIKSHLRPGSQYQRVISALLVLKDILESNLDPAIPFKVRVSYPFQISMFDNEMVRFLFDSVLSTYDDIRALSSWLLLASNMNFSLEQKERLVSKGFNMLDDYTTCDSGAKLLELSYDLFGNKNVVFDQLLKRIPLNDNIFEAVRKPIDGYFNALALILKHFQKFDRAEEIIEIVVTNWNNVKEILSHDSPEGCDMYGVGSAQLVLSYGWRSTKESTILINELLRFDLSTDQLLRIGELTLDQLSTVRHRGAFSSVYPTFITLATVSKDKLPGQNEKWLDFNISLIQTKTQLITRRSGGLPYLITAILTVENDLFELAFNKLLEIASIPVNEDENESEKMDIPQVHAFNCIKHLFIESQLSSACAPFIYKALELSLSTFSSKIWSVRNCSIMLFTALQNRLFGRKKMSARVFFSRFKGIKSILIEILNKSISTQSGEHLEVLFPVLTVLSKLESTPGYNGLSEFKPLIRACLKSKVWKIRESASRALPALISDEAAEESLMLLRDCTLKNQNQLHGHLLSIHMLSCFTTDFVNEFFVRIDEFLCHNPCFVTKKAYVQILSDIFVKFGYHEQVFKICSKLFIDELKLYEVDGSKQLFLQDLIKFLIEYDQGNKSLYVGLGLSSDFYESQLEAIKYIVSSVKNDISFTSELSKIATNEEQWTYVRSKAIPLIDTYPIDQIFRFATDQSQYGEDIKRSALELLGSVLAKRTTTHENYMKYLNLLRENSHEDQPFTIRLSVLNSVLRFLAISPKQRELRWIMYTFLTDDDEEIRQLAADYFRKGSTPFSLSNTEWIVKEFGEDSSYTGIILDQVLKFNPKMLQSTFNNQVEKVLFVTEKGNFYKNTIDQLCQLVEMTKRQWVSFVDSDRQLIVKHIQSLISKLSAFIIAQNHKEADDILGWCTDEIIFADIYGVLYFAKNIEGVDLTEIKTSGVKFHQGLSSLLE